MRDGTQMTLKEMINADLKSSALGSHADDPEHGVRL